MIDIAVLRAMVAAGASAEVLLAAIELAMQPEIERRKRDAERKRRAREKRPRTSAPVTGQSCDPPRVYTTPPIEKPKKVSLSRGTRLSADWQASIADIEFARQQGMSDNEIADEECKFRDYWIARPGTGGCKVDWPATWRNWIRNRRSSGRGNGGAPRPGSREDRQERSANAYRKLSEYVEAHSDEAGRGNGVGPEVAPRLSLVKPARS